LFYYAPNTTWQIGLNGNTEERKGGDMQVLKGAGDALHRYFEETNSQRLSALLKVERALDSNMLTVKNSVSYFLRKLKQPQYRFEGQQLSTFTEISLHTPHKISEWVYGLNLYSDNFHQRLSPNPLQEKQLIGGAFVQNSLKLSPKVSVEAGLRSDYAKDYQWFVLPRLSLMYKPSGNLTTRLGGGLGYKLPTLFTEESEETGFKNIAPISSRVEPETSEGMNWDVNYRTIIGDRLRISFNQLFFFTRLHHPVVFSEVADSSHQFYFYNSGG
jgi:iron complex outermembrane receptor protein